METLTLIQTIVSLLSLLITLYVSKQVISIKKTLNGNSNNMATQSNNKIGGDNAGRDIKK